MVKARLGNKDGSDTYFFGLSEGNIKRLRMGEPIVVDMQEMGGPANCKIAIAWGPTEEKIVSDMRAAGLQWPEKVQ